MDLSSQDEIAKFLKICKRSENESGFITKNIFDLEPNKITNSERTFCKSNF